MQPQGLAVEKAHCNSPDVKVKAFLPPFCPGQGSEHKCTKGQGPALKEKIWSCVSRSQLFLRTTGINTGGTEMGDLPCATHLTVPFDHHKSPMTLGLQLY